MVPEYWLLGEDLQDRIRGAGYDSPTVEGIAVDIHDLLQSAARIEQDLAAAIVKTPKGEQAKLLELMRELRYEFEHIGWHCENATQYLGNAIEGLESEP